MDAIVIAGGRIRGQFAAVTGQEIKALLSINGRTLLERTLRALEHSESVNRIVAVGPPAIRECAEAAGADLFIPESKTGIDNLMAGVKALEAEGQVLVSSSDLALAEPADVDDLVRRVPETACVSYAVISREEYMATFPSHTRARFVGLKDGRFTGGSMFIVEATTLLRLEPLLQSLFRARKVPVALGWRVGYGAFVRFALSLLLGSWMAPTSEQLRVQAERILGCEATLVRGASPRLALDVDSRKDWEFVKSYLEEKET